MDGRASIAIEDFGLAKVPAEVLVITAGCDVQADRLEVSFAGFARDGTCLVLVHTVLYGPTDADQVWQDLDDVLKQRWPHPLGGTIGVDATAIDAGDGGMFDKVLKFAAARASRRVWAIKGASGFARPAFKASAALKGRASQRLYIVGVDSIKSLLFQRLKRGQSVRFSNTLDGSYFEQLASERLVTRYLRGRPERRFERVVRRRAETLDALVYCHAAREGCAKSRRARGRIEARSAKHGAGKGHTIKMVGWHLAQLTQDGAAASAWRLCGEVTFMKFAVGIIGAIFAVISGFCWLKAARIKVPTLGAVYGGPPRMIVESANNQAWWNSRAAWFASGAAFAQALTILI